MRSKFDHIMTRSLLLKTHHLDRLQGSTRGTPMSQMLQRNARRVQGLVQLADKYPIIDVRGRGLMCAVEFGGHDGSLTASPGVAAAVTKAAGKRNMLLLTAGTLLSKPLSCMQILLSDKGP